MKYDEINMCWVSSIQATCKVSGSWMPAAAIPDLLPACLGTAFRMSEIWVREILVSKDSFCCHSCGKFSDSTRSALHSGGDGWITRRVLLALGITGWIMNQSWILWQGPCDLCLPYFLALGMKAVFISMHGANIEPNLSHVRQEHERHAASSINRGLQRYVRQS